MLTGSFLSILKPFITLLGFIATATICHLTTLKNCMREYLLCQQLSRRNFSFYFVLNLDTGPIFNITILFILFLSLIFLHYISIAYLNNSITLICHFHIMCNNYHCSSLCIQFFEYIHYLQRCLYI